MRPTPDCWPVCSGIFPKPDSTGNDMNDILITAPLPDFLKQPLTTTYTCHDYHGAADKAALLKAVGAQIIGLVQGGGSLAPTELLDQLPHLQIISVFGVGYDGVPVDYCRRRGIKV